MKLGIAAVVGSLVVFDNFTFAPNLTCRGNATNLDRNAAALFLHH